MKRLLFLVSLFCVSLFLVPGLLNAQAHYAYITNYNSNNVSVIDTDTDAVIATIPVGTSPFGVAVGSNRKVYISNKGSHDVSVIDCMTNQVVAVIPIDQTDVAGIAVNPSGTRVYVAFNKINNSSLAVIDTKTNTVISRVDAGYRPFGVAVNPKGNHFYVVNRYFSPGSSYGTLKIFNALDNSFVAEIGAGDDPLGVAVDPFGAKIYVVGDQQVVFVIDAETLVLKNLIQVGMAPWGITVNPSGTRVYVANRIAYPGSSGGSISVIDTATETVSATLEVGKYPVGLSVSLSGSKLYIAQGQYDPIGNVGVIDTSQNTLIKQIPVGNRPFAFGQFILQKDVIPPSVSITSPANNSKVIENQRVQISAIASDNVRVTKVKFFINGKLLCIRKAGPTYRCSWVVPTGTVNSFRIKAKAFDSSGNFASNIIKVYKNL